MIDRLVITDLTQMPDSDKVCVVGITEIGETIRPIYENGFQKLFLYKDNQFVVRPKSIVEWDFIANRPVPPHIEDKIFDPDSLKSHGLCDDANWERILNKVCFSTVADIYQGFLRYNRWVAPGSPTRSIATLANPVINSFHLNIKEDGWTVKPELCFRDDTGDEFQFKVNDWILREFCYQQVIHKKKSVEDIEMTLNSYLNNVDRIYLRIGLARPIIPTGGNAEHCYLQVTGIFTFPDRLNSTTYADIKRIKW